MLPSTQRTAFEKDGFLHLPKFLSTREQDQISKNLQNFIEFKTAAMPPEHVFCETKDDLSTLKQLQHLEHYDPFFKTLIHSGPLPDLAAELLESDVSPRNLQYFDKPPNTSLPTPPHQDGYYFMLEPCHAITLWLALDAATEETGGVRYVKTSHLSGLRPHAQTNTLGFSQGIEHYPSEDDLRNEVMIPAQPGDLLVHHALTVHRADRNMSSTQHRRALGFIYYDTRARENTRAHHLYQESLRDKLKNQGRI